MSPFQAIIDYELSLGIPPGWVNHSISKTAPNGFWHRLERGSIPMDEAFFAGFSGDLHDLARWEAFYRAQQGESSGLAKEVPPLPKLDGEWLFNQRMKRSTQPDPWMFPALQNLKSSGKYILGALSNTVIFPPGHPLFRLDYYDNPIGRSFDVFISSAHVGMRKPEPEIYQLALREVGRFARANARSDGGLDLRWQDGVRAEQVLFLDDIGENLRTARQQGFRTIKVPLGRAFEAVDELERITGLRLAGSYPRIPVKQDRQGTKAKM